MRSKKGFLRRIPLRMQFAVSFCVFTILISGLLWLFEIVLLEKFYSNSKVAETRRISESLVQSYYNDPMADFLKELNSAAINNQMCITVLDESHRYKRDVMNNTCLLHGIGSLQDAFLKELENSKDGTISLQVYNEQIGMEMLVYGTTFGENGEVQGCIFLNAILEPVGSTVKMLKRGILLFSSVVLVIGCAIAFWLSSRLSVPIVRITESAKRMAHGDYATRFEGGSCREVDELARALAYAEKEISRADAMQRDLVANVSHDLRTPLTMLKAYAEMIRDLSGDDPVKRNAHLQVIIDETDRLTALVNDILDLSKLESGSQKLELETIDAANWLADIVERYKGISGQMGYHIDFTPDAPKQITCDPAKLERVVCNLIHNAINYTGEDKQVFVRQINTEKGVRIEVQDTGDGIEEDKIARIFDKYYRSENHKREVVGTGLGLSIVKAILKMHNCSYGVRSRLGEGSVFWFEITQDAKR